MSIFVDQQFGVHPNPGHNYLPTCTDILNNYIFALNK
jgi:hypothetical protein